MKTNVKFLAPVAALMMVLGVGLAGCEREGPAERAGEQLDRAAEKTGDKIEKAGDKIERKAD